MNTMLFWEKANTVMADCDPMDCTLPGSPIQGILDFGVSNV